MHALYHDSAKNLALRTKYKKIIESQCIVVFVIWAPINNSPYIEIEGKRCISTLLLYDCLWAAVSVGFAWKYDLLCVRLDCTTKVSMQAIDVNFGKSSAIDTSLWLWHIWILCTPGLIVHVICRTWYKLYGKRTIMHSGILQIFALSSNFYTIGLQWHKII